MRARDKGYYQQSADECFQAVLCTYFQIDPDHADAPPRTHIDKRLAAGEDPASVLGDVDTQIRRWLRRRGVRPVFTRRITRVMREEAKWIGVVEFPGVANDHCFLMSHERIVWDPVQGGKWLMSMSPGLVAPEGMRPAFFTVDDVTLALLFRQRRN